MLASCPGRMVYIYIYIPLRIHAYIYRCTNWIRLVRPTGQAFRVTRHPSPALLTRMHRREKTSASIQPGSHGVYTYTAMLGGWANPHREQQTIPQSQTSIPPKIFLHANGQRPKRASIRQRLRRRQKRGEPHTEHGLGVLLELPALTALAQHSSHSHSGIDEMRSTEKFVHILDLTGAAQGTCLSRDRR